MKNPQTLLVTAIIATLTFVTSIVRADDRSLPGTTAAAKQSIIAFVERVTNQGSPDFVVPAERIATFDNDGTLWWEQPMYFQAFFSSIESNRWPRSIRNGRTKNPSHPCSRAT